MKRLFFVLICSLPFITANSQNKTIELSHYLFPEFTQGYIYMKSGVINKGMLNLNTLTEEMLFMDKGKILAIGKTEIGLVDSVVIKGRTFVVLNEKFSELLLKSSIDLYAEYRCSVIPPGKPAAYGGTSHTSASSTYSSMYSGGLLYNLKLPEGYIIKPYTNFWLKRDGTLKKFVNLKQLRKLFKDKSELFDSFVKENDVKFEEIESIVSLVSFLEVK